MRRTFMKSEQWKKVTRGSARLLALSFLLLVVPIVMQAQEGKPAKREVSGVIMDEKGEPLPNSNVFVKGTVIGVSAGVDGTFKLNIPQQPDNKPIILVFTYIGFQNQEITLGESNKLKVKLKEEVNKLDEVTAIAYGNRKQRDLVTSVSSVKAKDIEDMPSASIDNLLQGKMAGVQVINQSGAPGGGGTSVNIRGFNSLFQTKTSPSGNKVVLNTGQPLYIVDGVPIDASTDNGGDMASSIGGHGTGTSALADLDPSTIESVTVLKDAASASLYGSRAANGVILITTKQGKEGKAKITANITYGESILPVTNTQTIGKAERDWQLLKIGNTITATSVYDPATQGYSYILPTSYNNVYGSQGTYDDFYGNGTRLVNSPMVQDSLNAFYNNNTNWWKYMFKPSSTVNGNATILGGTELIKYMVSIGVFKQNGIMPNSNYQRGNFTTNLSITPRKGFVLNSRTYLSFTDRSLSPGGVNGGQNMTAPVYSTSSLIPGSGSMFDAIQNVNNNTLNKSVSYRLMQSLKATIDLYKELRFSSTFSIDYSQNNSNIFYPAGLAPGTNYGLNKTIGSVSATSTINNENLLTDKFVIGEHTFDVLLGQTYLYRGNSAVGGNAMGVGSDYIHYSSTGSSNIYTQPDGTVVGIQQYYSNADQAKMLSFLGRVAYNYKKRYMLEASFRRDGSSVFGANNRWAMFPSLAAGWMFSKETFAKDLYWLSEGKLRASWGQTGSQFSDPYLALGIMSADQSAFMGNTGMVPSSLLNSNLGWEQSDQYDFGLDVSLFDYRLQFKLDYYNKLQSQQLYLVSLPGDVFYLPKEWLNAMKTSNQGIDLEMSYDVIRDKKLTWSSSMVLNRNWNKFLSSYNDMDINPFILGAPSSRLHVYKTEGIIQSANDIPTTFIPTGGKREMAISLGNPYQVGMMKIQDLNGDGLINDNDMVYQGSTFPLLDGGWTNTFKYGNFDASLLLTFTVGRDMINALKYSGLGKMNGSIAPMFYDYSTINYWTPNNPTASMEAPNNTGIYSTMYTPLLDKNIEHVSYARLKKITLGYKVPVKHIQQWHIQGVRFYGTIENLFLLSNYSGPDPETVPIQTGIDNGDNYPLARTFTLGMTVNF